MSSIPVSATSTIATSIPTGTISAIIGSPPNTTKDYYVAKYLLMAFGLKTDPIHGALIPPRRPVEGYVFETRGPRILTSMSIAIATMIIITGLRLGLRIFRRGLWVGLDDYTIVPGVLLAICWPTLQMCAVIYGGAGKHMYDITYEEFANFKHFSNLSKPIFFISVGMIKVSICFFNRRLTSMTSRPWLIFNNVFLVLLVAYIILSLFWTIFQCNPAFAGWDPIRVAKEGKEFQCMSDNIVGSTLSVIHVIMDFVLLSVPLIVLWKVRMGWGTKLRLYFVFSIGAVSCVGSVMRQIEQKKLSRDTLWNFVLLQDWTLVDLTFGVVAASLPILSAFIPASWKSVRGTTDASTGKKGASGAHNLNGTGGFVRTTRRTSISGKREFSDSMENIVRTDVIELSFENKSVYLDGESVRGNSAGGKGAAPKDWNSDETFPNHFKTETWVGRGSGKADT
ncbi:related to integral membrane protein PTH11 [Rhynchosporium agropyri]|uniref:Related to integral membrane protein PTH11 n=1 Tax=Rhynchosporium agropyri TaxID=914238 RepID=A0A1E1K5H5_9HELO|nr:related to integral membrane protein PTH11 [Rhynchosporium agropyri]